MRHGEKLLDEKVFRASTGLSQRELASALETGRVFGVEINGVMKFPAFYCDPLIQRRRLYAVSRRLGDLPGGSKLAFFVTPKGSLNRATPLQALATGNTKGVLAAADGVMQR